MGRFINADVFASTGQGLLGNNMFAYCNNNPVYFYDETGMSASMVANPNVSYYEDTSGGGGGGVVLATIALGKSIVTNVSAFVDYLWDSISQSYARTTSRTYQSPTEVHHVVAKKAWNAAPAAAILNQILPNGVENPINKISIKTGLHRRLHTHLYYGIANAIVIHAYYSSNDPIKQQQNVVVALGVLRGIVAYLNTMAPY